MLHLVYETCIQMYKLLWDRSSLLLNYLSPIIVAIYLLCTRGVCKYSNCFGTDERKRKTQCRIKKKLFAKLPFVKTENNFTWTKV